MDNVPPTAVIPPGLEAAVDHAAGGAPPDNNVNSPTTAPEGVLGRYPGGESAPDLDSFPWTT